MAAALNNIRKLHQKQPAEQPEAFSFTSRELDKIRAAVKEEEFVRLLAEYARELSDPENRRRYEADIAALEQERGYGVTFLNPRPGWVVKVSALPSSGGQATTAAAAGGKVFINICSDANLGRPVSEAAGSGGLKWSIPYSVSQPRRDCDKSGAPCAGECCSPHHLI